MASSSLTVDINQRRSELPPTPPASSISASLGGNGTRRDTDVVTSGRTKLRDLLRNDEDFKDAQQASANFFDDHLKHRLTLLYQAHVGRMSVPEGQVQTHHSDPHHVPIDTGSEIVGSSTGTRDSERPKAKKSVYDPWKRFRNLDTVSLDPWVQTHLDRHGGDPLAFLDDKHPLMMDAQSLKGDRIADVFGACFEYTRQLERRNVCDEFRWFFMMLLFHDIGIAINPDSRAEKSPGRFGRQMAEKTSKYLERALEQDEVDIDLEDLRANLTKWSCIGRKLTYFCQHFGPGSIFFLRQHLKEHFLNKEISFSGSSFDLGRNHLTGLGLQQKAKESGADELAINIRHLTSRSFRQAAGIREPR